ncbi:hypothetical protein ES703_125501 [subsurface metagenome]
MKFGFVEEAALGEFEFVAWSLLDRREIITLDINGDRYDSGMTVKVKHKAKNFGDGASKAVIEVRDADTGDFVTTYGSADIIPPGAIWRVDAVEIGKMPKKDWRLEFKVTP